MVEMIIGEMASTLEDGPVGGAAGANVINNVNVRLRFP
jgi:hypothetical protein